jgi:ornithine cyclodeaminase/alanine dehydrogenase-like protein (mu-crystallin family)
LLRPAHVERVAFMGAGIQARSHAEVIALVLPGVELAVYDVHAERAQAFAEEVQREHDLTVRVVDDARAAAAQAQVVITMARLGGISQVMTPDWVSPATLVIAVDFATYASAELARASRLFAVDDREQFYGLRASGRFDGYPDPTTTLGELIGAPQSAVGDPTDERPVLVNHLGIGLADVVFADAVARRAADAGRGTELKR